MIRTRHLNSVVIACALMAGCKPDATPLANAPAQAPAAAAAAAATTVPPWFTEEARARGIDFVHQSGYAKKPLMPEMVGSGGGLVDVDGDGDLDVYLVQSGWNLRDGQPAGSAANILYFNRGDGHFVPAADPGAAADRGYGIGVTAGDYDNDGDVDLYVTNVGPNVLLRNDGSGHFDDVTAAAGVGDEGWGTSAAFADFDSDGHLDLIVINYMNWSPATERDCLARGSVTYCSPKAYQAPAMDRLYRNNGDGTFADVTLAAGLNTAFGNGLGVVLGDFNLDGWLDFFVANDGLPDQLWINQGGFRFVDEAVARGVAVNDEGLPTASMGVVAEDADFDGDPDLLIGNLDGENDSFFRNEEGRYFVYATPATGIAMLSRKHTRFGITLVDFDNDGRLDLYQANGKVEGDPDAVPDAFAEPNLLFRGVGEDGGKRGAPRFVEQLPAGGVTVPLVHTGRGLASGDIDGDGDVDLLVVNRDAAPYLLINQVGAAGNWLRFRVRTGTRDAMRDAIGAVVSADVGATRRSVTVQFAGSYLAANDPSVHVGMGNATTARNVQVRWPDGKLEAFGDFNARQLVVLQQGGGRPMPDGSGGPGATPASAAP